MSPDEVLGGLAEILGAVAGVRPADVTPDASFADLGIDSLTMVEIVVAAEQRFSIRIPDETVADLVTVGDAVSYVERAQAAA
jgi:acyl carrier protein